MNKLNKPINMKSCLIVVDAQYDFIPVSEEDYKNKLGGALAVPDGDQIVPVINKLLPKFDLVIFTKDWHLRNNIYFASQHPGKKPFDQMIINGKMETLWPDHCIQDTQGAVILEDINFNLIDGEFFIFKKGDLPNWHPYGGFGDEIKKTELENFLKERGVTDVIIVGLALDYCVKDTAIGAVEAGFKTTVIEDGTRAISEDLNELLTVFKEKKIRLIESYEYEYITK